MRSSMVLVPLLIFLIFVASENTGSIDYDSIRKLADSVPVIQLKQVSSTLKNENWMSLLPEKLQKMPLSGIAIPGSHDSFSAKLVYKEELGPTPDLSDTLIKVINFFGKSAKKIIYNWGTTQSLSLMDQLIAGIRYLDFRVARRESKHGDIYLLHSLYAQSAQEALETVNYFLIKHEKEVVIIDINRFYGMSTSDHEEFMSSIINIFGDKLATVRSMEELTLLNLWKNKQQLILIYHYYVPEIWRFWSGKYITAPYPGTNSKKTAIEKLDSYYNQSHNLIEGFWVTQGILTPLAKDIIVGFYSSLRTKLGLPMCKEMSKWVRSKKIGQGGLNIVITDFVGENDFIKNVIDLNFK